MYRDENSTVISFDTDFLDSVQPTTIKSVKLTNHFRAYTGVKSGIECWKKCLFEVDCVAISYSEGTCYLFKKGDYGSELDSAYVSMGYHREEFFIRKTTTTNPNKRFLNPIKRLNGSCENKDQCWIECLNVVGCAAISFCLAPNCSKTCNLYKQGDYGVTKDVNYVSMALQSEAEFIEKQPVISIYKDYRIIIESKKSINWVENEEECWSECLKERAIKCEVISFSMLNSICYFYEIRARRLRLWQVVIIR